MRPFREGEEKIMKTIVMGLALFAANALAAGETPAAAPAAPPTVACPTDAAFGQVAVLEATRVDVPKSATPDEAHTVWLRSGIELKVKGLQTLLDKSSCGAVKRKIVLFLDGRPVPDLLPYPPTDPQSGVLRFELKRDEASRDVWTHLLGRARVVARETQASVGLADGYPVPSNAKVRFEVINLGWLATWAGVLLVLGLVFWRLAAKSDMLRDYGATPVGGGAKAYSLARVQAAVWFFLTLASYAFIGLITGDYDSTITGTVLALMGISAGTALGSSLIDADPKTGAAGAAAAAAGPPPAPATAGFLRDVLSDDHGVNFHRFQMFAWTLVLGIIFLHEVWANLAMPQFNGTLLGLLGISSGTYLGLKMTNEGP
jgi:hypothetical protein